MQTSFVSVFYAGHKTQVKICLCVMCNCEVEFCIKLSRVPLRGEKRKKDLLLLKYEMGATTCSSATLFLCG